MFIINLNISNKFDCLSVHRIMNTSGLLKVNAKSFTLQETRSIHDSMNRSKIEFISKMNTITLDKS